MANASVSEGFIWLVNKDGGFAALLTHKGRSPVFSPDGRWILYEVYRTYSYRGEGHRWSGIIAARLQEVPPRNTLLSLDFGLQDGVKTGSLLFVRHNVRFVKGAVTVLRTTDRHALVQVAMDMGHPRGRSYKSSPFWIAGVGPGDRVTLSDSLQSAVLQDLSQLPPDFPMPPELER